MKNYEKYTVEDFVMDDEFRDWVQGDSQRESFWLSFVQNHPEKKQDLRLAEQLIRAASVANERLSEKEIRDEVHTFIDKAQFQPILSTPLPTPATRPVRKAMWSYLSIAALLVLALGLGWYMYWSPAPHSGAQTTIIASKAELTETYNDTPGLMSIRLSDGTEVLLSPQSRLLYPDQFTDSSRLVHLTGEASFSVKRSFRPFMVYSGEMVTKVLGTRFVVRAFDQDKNYTVQVQSGKVSVYATRAEPSPASREINGLILTANQAAIFETEARQLTKTVVANPSLLKAPAESSGFIYDEVPLSAVLNELELHCGIPIQFDRQSFSTCRITATLTNETLYEKLDLLCKTVSATYEIVDGQIVVSGKGCE